ncbi:hypothetical protein [Streptomyces hundungensis]|uniref:hypothetical protein n=1 Tax=Streptomyces hundungensis TaxID=1077946 RepID=UPI0031E58E14
MRPLRPARHSAGRPAVALSAVALSLGAGLLAAPPAAAASTARPVVTAPRTGPTPGSALTGTYKDCFTTATSPGWIGANTGVTLTVATDSPAHRRLATAFRLRDEDSHKTEWHQTGWSGAHGDATVRVGPLTDGHQYRWSAVTTDTALASGTSTPCSFRVDRTPPTSQITSTDFPAAGSVGVTPKKHAGEEGVFSLLGSDPAPAGGRASGVACARWTTNVTEAEDTGWRCADGATDNRIVRLTDGRADIKVTPASQGTNTLYLRTQDDAGNLSQLSVYQYYAPAKPAAPTPVFGDIDGDAKPDVLLPDGAGNLGQAGPGADPAAPRSAGAASAPGGNGWAEVQYTHRGSLGYSNVDDLIAHATGDRALYVLRNDGGVFDGQSPSVVNKPSACARPDGTELACGDVGLGADWSGVPQVVAFGSPTGDSGQTMGTGIYALPRTSLVFVENGRLWLALAGTTNQVDNPAILLSDSTQWGDYDLIAPGRAKGTDFPTLWARSRHDGTLHAFGIGGSAEAPDFSAFADPSQGLLSGTVDPAVYAHVGSDGDLTGDGIPDLWAVDAQRRLVVWKGTGTAPDPASGVLHPTVTGVVPSS